MSSPDSGAHPNPLIRALADELGRDPVERTELPAGLQQRRDSWLAGFRAGTLPFQQDDDPVLDTFEVEHWLLLNSESAFRSRAGTAEPSTPTWRASDDDGVVVVVQRTPDPEVWQVRLRNAAPGRYRLELHWDEIGTTASVEVAVGNRSEFTPFPGPSKPPTHARFSRLGD